MSPPDRPSPDHYDNLPRVQPHFTVAPSLTAVPRGHHYNRRPGASMVDEVRNVLRGIYRGHGLQRCTRYGLHYAGTKADNLDETNDRIMLCVFELKEEDINKWRAIDGELRTILHHWGLSGLHGVCLRYYVYSTGGVADQLPPTERAASSTESVRTSSPAPEGAITPPLFQPGDLVSLRTDTPHSFIEADLRPSSPVVRMAIQEHSPAYGIEDVSLGTVTHVDGDFNQYASTLDEYRRLVFGGL